MQNLSKQETLMMIYRPDFITWRRQDMMDFVDLKNQPQKAQVWNV